MNNATLDPAERTQDHETGTEVGESARTTRTGIVLSLALAALAVPFLVVMTWDGGAEPAAPEVPTAGPPPAYQPGGSVYEQQVPDSVDWALVYGPGGAIYKSQVPSGR